ncbi:MAG: hypothetical protein AYK18_04225 [Theionarchaea archaeon DG-70]|nr:MAG: hypothetical protein AYK18_04225 [Theionarchaea archaeon DG-70]
MTEPSEIYYGYRINRYITGLSIGIGIAAVLLVGVSIMRTYPLWAVILSGGMVVILCIFGVFWYFTMDAATNPKTIELFKKYFGDFLRQIWDGKGKALDIGTGRGVAAITVAKQFPAAQVVGVDTWSRMWGWFGMTKEGCELNARIEKVQDRCTFTKGNALELPFEEGTFGLVVSTFAFHEIRVPDRMVLFEEVLRVGVNAVEEMVEKIEGLGAQEVIYTSLEETGIELGRLRHIKGMGFLMGKKGNNGRLE